MSTDYDWYDFMDAAVDKLTGADQVPLNQFQKELEAAREELSWADSWA